MENVRLEHTSSCGSLTKLTLIAKHGEIMGDKLQKKICQSVNFTNYNSKQNDGKPGLDR